MENVQLRIVWIITLEKQLIFSERIFGHIGRDTHSDILKHSIETGHKPLQVIDYSYRYWYEISQKYHENKII